MVLKCKLQKSIHPSLVDKSDKVLVGIFQGFSIFNTSQLFFLLSFLGVIGVLVWLVQSANDSENTESSDDSSSSNNNNSSSSSKNKQDFIDVSNEDENEGSEEFRKLFNQQNNAANLKKRNDNSQQSQQQVTINRTVSQEIFRKTNTRQIDTIYECANESTTQEDTSLVKIQLQNQKQIQQIQINNKNVSESVDSFLNKTIFQQQQQQQQQAYVSKSQENISQEQSRFQQENLSSRKTEISKSEKNLSETNDLVDQLIEGLVTDRNEDYAYSKHEKQKLKLFTNDSTSSKTSLAFDSDSRNSLLELYNVKHVNAIEDRFQNLIEISDAIKNAGLENSQLIFGIDFTISNLENGTLTFNGRSLHYNDDEIKNPYQKVIEILGKTLECFDVDGRIPAFGFGDLSTKDRKVFPFSETGYCLGFKDVLKRYNEIVKTVQLSGPTNFAPLIKEAIRIVKETKQYHILVIVADGQVTNERQTRNAIVEASKYALSIIMVGVGDGPWDTMNEFDDSLPKRQFDNFQFVNYHEVIAESNNPDETFALHALMEIPDQFKMIKELGLLKKLK